MLASASPCLCGEPVSEEAGSEPPLSVSADRAVSQRAGRDERGRELTRARFSGKVEAVRGDVKLTCRELEVLFAREGRDPGAEKAGAQGRPLEARATGGVVVSTPGSRAVAEEAVYDVYGERITLSGKARPVLYYGPDAVAAESFVLHRSTRIAEARGRTSAVIEARRPAAEAADAGGLAPSAGKKTRIDATDGAVYDEGRRELFLKGGVVVQQEGFRLRCDRLWARFGAKESKPKRDNANEEPAGAPGKPTERPPADPAAKLQAGELERLVASGGVRLDTETRTMESELAEYDAAKRTAVLAGETSQPEVREGGNRLTAPQIVYHLDEDRLESRGGPFKVVIEAKR